MPFSQAFFPAVSILIALLSFAFAAWLYGWVKKQPVSNERIIHVGGLIRRGANTFLAKEYMVLAKFVGVASLLIFLFLPSPIWKNDFIQNLTMAIAYITGAVFSSIAGKIGIQVATIANMRTAESAKKGIRPAFMSGFRGGAEP